MMGQWIMVAKKVNSDGYRYQLAQVIKSRNGLMYKTIDIEDLPELKTLVTEDHRSMRGRNTGHICARFERMRYPEER